MMRIFLIKVLAVGIATGFVINCVPIPDSIWVSKIFKGKPKCSKFVYKDKFSRMSIDTHSISWQRSILEKSKIKVHKTRQIKHTTCSKCGCASYKKEIAFLIPKSDLEKAGKYEYKVNPKLEQDNCMK